MIRRAAFGETGCPQQLQVIEGVDAGFPSVDEKEAEDCRQHHKAAQLGEEEKFHGGVSPSLMSPQGDEEVHGHEHELPEEVEEKEIHGDKDADDPRQGGHQVEMEKPDVAFDLGPRSQHGRQAQEDGEKDEQKAQPVHGQVKADPQGGNPGPVELGNPRTRGRARVALPAPPQAGKQCQVGGQGDQGYPARKPVVPPGCDPGCKPPRKGDEGYPQKDHGSS